MPGATRRRQSTRIIWRETGRGRYKETIGKRKRGTAEMATEIRVLRGNQIGGCVVLISTERAKICIDYGENLPGQEDEEKTVGLDWENEKVDGVFFTHYHGDHIGGFMEIPAGIPLYMGEVTRQVMLNIRKALHRDEEAAVLSDRNRVRELRAKHTIAVGDIRLTPYMVDHSAYDAYMFLIETPDKTILHTGDYRNHGYRGRALFDVLEKHVVCRGRRPVDVLITEGTMMNRSGERAYSEAELQGDARKLFQNHRHVFLICSSTNLDSLASFYQAGASCGMGMYGNSYVYSQLKTFRETAGKMTPCYTFQYAYEVRFDFMLPGLSITQEQHMRDRGFVTVIKGTPAYEKWIERFADLNPIVVYSMWEGYLEPWRKAYDPVLHAFTKKYHAIHMHTSGHAPAEVIAEVINRVSPREAIIPIHTENAAGFWELKIREELKNTLRLL